jgi:hypothetical protein
MSSLRRCWKFPKISESTCYSSGGQLRPVRLPVRAHHLRSLSTATPGPAGAPSRSLVATIFSLRSALTLALGGVFLGVGFAIGADFANDEQQPPLKPVYGTPEHFALAIGELKASFAGEAVTTAPDQLAAHGYSPNCHHPGMPPCFCIQVFTAVVMLIIFFG